MEIQPVNKVGGEYVLRPLMGNQGITIPETSTDELYNLFRQLRLPWLDDILSKLTTSSRKKSFLVSRNNKYITVPTENIALFYVRYEAAMMLCFDREEYFVDYSLEQLQGLLPDRQFYRLNRQYLINFHVIKEVEHYFARKLLVNAVIPTKDKLVVSKDKVSAFLHWLDNR